MEFRTSEQVVAMLLGNIKEKKLIILFDTVCLVESSLAAISKL